MADYHTDNAVFLVYKDWETLFDSLDSNEEAGELIKALFAFAKRGEIAEFSGALKMAFIIMSRQLDKDGIKWQEKCEKNASNGSKGGRPKKQTDFEETEKSERFFEKPKKADKDKEKDKDKEEDKEKDIIYADKPQTRKRFSPPSVEEVSAYCKERGSTVDAQRFVNYYSSNGWKVGRNPMKDWKAAVRTWERNNYGGKSNASQQEVDYYAGLDDDKIF